MFARHRCRRRHGATLVEFAVVAPVVLFFFFALIIGGLGVFRYQEVAHLARDAARFASTHGGNYQWEGVAGRTGVPAVASSDDIKRYLADKMGLLDPDRLTVRASWVDASGAPITYTPVNLPVYVDITTPIPGQNAIQNFVKVTLTYRWFPELYVAGPVTLTSTSVMPMSY